MPVGQIILIAILWITVGFTIGIMVERHNKNKVGTPSASHNTERQCATQIFRSCFTCRWYGTENKCCNCDIDYSSYEPRKTSAVS